MLLLDNKTQQDFLNREWVQKLLDAGVDMSDAKYCIMEKDHSGEYFITLKDIESASMPHHHFLCPTYTVSELLYKLHEWLYIKIEGKDYKGGLSFIKDAPFYLFYYDLKRRDTFEDGGWSYCDKYLSANYEYPIESLASLLIQCHEKSIGSVRDIRGK